jgi:hypothetical protein
MSGRGQVSPEALADRADWLEGRLNGLPYVDGSRPDRLRERQAAIDELAVTCTKLTDHRAVIGLGADAAITMMGIRSVSTMGVVGAMRNWVRAARVKAGVAS